MHTKGIQIPDLQHTQKKLVENFFNLWKSICGLLWHSSLVFVGLDQNLLEKKHVLGMFEAESMEKRYEGKIKKSRPDQVDTFICRWVRQKSKNVAFYQIALVVLNKNCHF